MSRDIEQFVSIAFFMALIILIFFLLQKKLEEKEQECNDVCAPLQYHVLYNGVTYNCACEERNPGVIRFRNGKSH